MRLAPAERERVALIGLRTYGVSAWDVEDHLDELASLAFSAGAEVLARFVQVRSRPTPDCFIGRGRAVQIGEEAHALGAATLIFDDELSPAQVRNLEEATELKVIDRTELILDIFAKRARTNEARVQVELAQLSYLMPRLTGRGVLLSRLGGGIGTRGPGETKLETDRRVIRQRVTELKRRLKRIARTRKLHREGRSQVPRAVLVGYTNVGKSTLLNALAGAEVTAEDKLFATLDSTTRRAKIGEKTVLLTDTVGFIRKFPPQLAASFRSTLEEAAEADLILHVVDVSHPGHRDQMATVQRVLEDLGAGEIPTLLIFNKSDRCGGELDEGFARNDAVICSARTGDGLDALRSALVDFVS